MLEYNKNYTILALNYILKNLKRIISASEIKRRCRNSNREYNIIRIYKTLKRVFVNVKE